MKKTFFTLAMATIITGLILTGCQSRADKVKDAEDKVENARDKVTEAQSELDKELNDSIQQFRQEYRDRIAAHDKCIAEFKARIASEKAENRAKYEKKLKELEQKNSDLKKDLDDYNQAGQSKWDSFKTKFSQDMNNLGKSLKNFFTD